MAPGARERQVALAAHDQAQALQHRGLVVIRCPLCHADVLLELANRPLQRFRMTDCTCPPAPAPRSPFCAVHGVPPELWPDIEPPHDDDAHEVRCGLGCLGVLVFCCVFWAALIVLALAK